MGILANSAIYVKGAIAIVAIYFAAAARQATSRNILVIDTM